MVNGQMNAMRVCKAVRAEVLLAAFRAPVLAELLQRCEIDSRNFAAVCARENKCME